MMRPFVSAALLAAMLGVPRVAQADPGELRGIDINTRGNNFGYWEYLPEAYDESQEWPVLIFLAGIGENGNGRLDPSGCANGPDTYTPDGPTLCRNLRHGPQHLLWNQANGGDPGLWNDEERPFIVISPQNPAPLYQMVPYDIDDLDAFVDYILDEYAADPRRIYLTGMSMGGYSTVLSIQAYPDRFSAVSIMPGIAGMAAAATACDLTSQNIWAFHGDQDGNPFNPTGVVRFIQAFNNCPGPRPTARMTMYTGAGHNVWTQTFSPYSGMNSPTHETWTVSGAQVPLDPYDLDIYSWLLMHDKPDVSAGADVEVTETTPNVELTATTIDADAISYTWTQQSGDSITLTNANAATVTVSGYAPGSYTFEVLAVDEDGQHDRDTVSLTVLESSSITAGETDGSGDGAETEGAELGGTGTGAGTSSADETGTAGGDSGAETGLTGAATGGGDDRGTTGGSTTSDGTPDEGLPGGDASASTGGTAGLGTGDDAGAIDDVGEGCSCSADARSSSPAWAAMLVVLGFVRRRRRT